MRIRLRSRSRRSAYSFNIPSGAWGSLVALVLGFAAGYQYHVAETPELFSSMAPQPTFQVCFSPDGNCEKVVIKAINTARKEILVQSFELTSQTIADALIKAHHRGVAVRVLCDKSQCQTTYSRIPQIKAAHIPVTLDRTAGLSHNKVMIIDNNRLLTGSYNWTVGANTRNAENLLVIHDPSLIKAYKDNWHRRYGQSTKVGVKSRQ